MNAISIQYQLSNGSWADCASTPFGDRTEYYLRLCERFNGVDTSGNIVPRYRAGRDLTRAEVVAALQAGQTLRTDAADWYSNCRIVPAPRPVRTEPVPTAPSAHTCYVCGARADMEGSLGHLCAEHYDSVESNL